MLNPITYTEQIIADFLKYQLTAYAFADANLHRQMRQLLNLDAALHGLVLHRRSYHPPEDAKIQPENGTLQQ